ncbi:hypothetical protein AMJ39_02310 [candidate division TA06 bacterium DG_24]|uniref:Uncharacterized protein n=1 Tax=candidate division TA06 bacterium DG_24 TaxID=1703770 RepID=A0A0S7WWP7_UNCT6|nr:MAG: hypothetical protein AMJ39_02310 [candidate division TA06 bacterium DG_24]
MNGRQDVTSRTAAVGFLSSVLLSLILYLATLCPTVYWEDSGELISAAYNLGIAHPPGHPLYVVSTRFTLLLTPFDPAIGSNAASAVAGSLAVGAIFLAIWTLCPDERTAVRFLASLTGALSLAVARTFWSQAVIAEVYSLACLVCALLLLLVLRWAMHRETNALMLAAFLFGLGMANHVFLGALLPGLALMAWAGPGGAGRGRGTLAITMALLVLLGLSLYLYLPLRSRCDPSLDWGDPERLDRLLDHVTAREFASEFFSLRLTVAGGPLAGMVAFVQDLPRQFGMLCVSAAAVGLVKLLRRRLIAAGLVVAAAGTILFAGFAGGGPDYAAYLLPAHLVAALLVGCGVSAVARWMTAMRVPAFIVPVLLPLLIVPEVIPNWDESTRHGVVGAREYVHDMAEILPQRALFITENSVDYFVLLYLQLVRGERLDVDPVYSPLLATEWYRERLRDRGLRLGNDRDEPGLPQAQIAGRGSVAESLAALNIDDRPVYYSPGPRFMIDPGRLVPCGLVYRCLRDERDVTQEELVQHRLLLKGYGAPRGRIDRKTRTHYALLHAHLGSYWFERQLFEEARHAYEQAELYDPRNPAIHYDLGVIFERLGSRDDAVAAYRRAVELGPEEADSRLRLADLLLREGLYEEGLQQLHQAANRHPRSSAVEVAMARAYLITGDIARGREAAARAIALDPASSEAHAVNGLSMRQGRDLREAVQAFLVALELEPGNEEARLNLALTYRELGMRPEAMHHLAILAEEHPEEELYQEFLTEHDPSPGGGREER